MKIGAYFVIPLHEGTIARDGGVAFGVIPRRDWSQIMPPDADNNVRFGLTHFLVQGHGRNILIDAGLGDKRSEEEERALGVVRVERAESLLEDVGVGRADIDLVVSTHLHFASAGGLTRLNEQGALVPACPNARVVIQNGEWERAVHSNLRTRGLYHKEDFEPLLWHQCVDLADGDQQVLPGLWVKVTGGHTKMHQIVVIESEGEGAVFWGDLIPSVHHIPLNAISALDLYPLRSMEMKAEWLTRAIDSSWVSFFSRDPRLAAAQLSGSVRDGVDHDPLLGHDPATA